MAHPTEDKKSKEKLSNNKRILKYKRLWKTKELARNVLMITLTNDKWQLVL